MLIYWKIDHGGNHKMRKLVKSGFILSLSAAILIAAAGCSQGQDNTLTAKGGGNSQSSVPTVIVDTTGIYGSLQECIDDPEVKAELDQMIADADDGEYKLKIFVEDETNLIYEYTYFGELPEDNGMVDLRTSIESTLASGQYALYYTTIAADLRHDVGDKSITVIVRYLDSTGSLLGEHQYIPKTAAEASEEAAAEAASDTW